MNNKLILLTTLFLLLSACTPVVDTPTPAPIAMNTPTPTTVLYTASPTHLPTKTPTSIPTLTLTHTLLTDEQIQAWFLENMITPECDLPCWLGITPGVSTWDSTKERLAPYVDRMSEGEYDGKLSGSATFHFSTTEMPDTVIFLSFSIRDNVVTSMSISGSWEAGYQLPELLSRYGVPGQVWVEGYFDQYNYSGPRGIMLYLYYPDKNFEAHFSVPPTAPIWTDVSNWQNCMKYGPNLYILEPDENRSFDDVAEKLSFDPRWPVIPISEALGMNVQSFYEVYQDAKDPICFNIPVELWLWEDATPSP